MQIRHVILGALVLAMGCSARHLNQERNVVYCSSDDIAHHRVSGCECRPKLKTDTCRRPCKTKSCTPQLTNFKHVNDCNAGCRLDTDGECIGCGLWFHSVCGCVKDPTDPKKCLTDTTVSQGSANTWIHLVNDDPKEHDLITSTSIIPGILDMTAAPSPYFERGWVYAQKQWNPDKQALAMNPWVVRTMEQVHIHMCKLDPDLRNVLNQEVFKSDKHLVRLDTKVKKYETLWCIGAKKDKIIDNFVELLAEMIKEQGAKTGGICPELIGAGMMMDDNKRTWACATTERHGPLGLFCTK